METLPFVSTVTAICVLALGLMTLVVTQVGHRIDEIGQRITDLDRGMGQRITDLDRGMGYRFDAVDQRIADLDRGVGFRFDAVDQRFTAVDQRFDAVDRRLEGLDGRVGRVESQNEKIIDAVADLGNRVTRLEQRTA